MGFRERIERLEHRLGLEGASLTIIIRRTDANDLRPPYVRVIRVPCISERPMRREARHE